MPRTTPLAHVIAAVLLPSGALAQAVPVIAVTVSDRAPSTDLVARAVAAAGADARHGAALSAALTERFGRFAPTDDPLRAQREEAAAAAEAYFDRASRARRRLEPAVRALEQSREALELEQPNRDVYLRALMTLARIEIEAEHSEAADAWLRRAIEFDPSWTPPVNWPPAVTRRYQELRASRPGGAPGALSVRAPREGCTVTVDGAAVPGASRDRELRVSDGLHRVAVSCDRPSRVRVVRVDAGGAVRAAFDPRLDAALQLSGPPAIAYPSASDATSALPGDVTTLGEALGARRVIAVDPDGARVVDVPSRVVRATVPAAAQDFDAQLRAALSEAPAVTPASVAAPAATPATTGRGPGAGPWVLAGVGGAAVVTGAVLLVLRNGEFDEAVSGCALNQSTGARQCGSLSDAASSAARAHYDTAATYNTAGWVAVGVGGAALAGGVLWYLLAPRSAPAVHVGLLPGGGALRIEGSFQ